MKHLIFIVGLTAALSGCARKESTEIPAGTDVTVQKKDGVNVEGRLVEAKAEEVVLQSADGVKRRVARADIASIKATPVDDAKKEPAPSAPAAPAAPVAPPPDDRTSMANKPDGKPDVLIPNPKKDAAARRLPEYREITIPAGTVLPLELKTAVASDTSKVEDQVRATLRHPVLINGDEALPAGTAVIGHVTSAERAGKVKGRASIAFRFNTIDLPGEGGQESISTATVTRVAPATKKKDATKIGIGAGAGAALGAILGGGSGAAKGAAIGGAAGTGAVLATRGDEVRLGPGAAVSTKLTAPLTVRVAAR